MLKAPHYNLPERGFLLFVGEGHVVTAGGHARQISVLARSVRLTQGKSGLVKSLTERLLTH